MWIRTVKPLLAVGMVLALGATACGATTTTVTMVETGGVGATLVEFQASPTFLAQSADRVEAVDSFRFELRTEITTGELTGIPMVIGSRRDALGFGEISGTRSSLRMDLASLGSLAQLGAALADVRLEMTMIRDETTMYFNAPVFGAIGAIGAGSEASGPELDLAQVVINGWGRIDAAALGGDDVDPLDALGGIGGLQGGGVQQMLALLDEAGSVTDGGQSEVRGVPTHVAQATVSVGDLVAMMDDDLERSIGIDRETEAEIGGLGIDIEVHIDDAGLVRRIEYVVDLDDIGSETADLDVEFSMWQQIDFFDLGEEIAIDLPADSVDITEAFLALSGLHD